MKTVQLLMDEDMKERADKEAKRMKRSLKAQIQYWLRVGYGNRFKAASDR